MKIIVPMAGSGQRFADAGYSLPKPFIPIHDYRGAKRLIEHVVDMFDQPDDRFIFIFTRSLDARLVEEIYGLRPYSELVAIAPHRLGPVYTVLAAEPYIDNDEEVVVAYCDSTLGRWNREAAMAHIRQYDLDGCLFTHTGFHPHTLSTTKMAFCKTDGELVTEVKEKSSYTDNPAAEHASSGVYYFRRGAFIKKYFHRLIDHGESHNGEFYVTLAYNPMIRDSLRVGYFDTRHVGILGTPEEVQNFEAWALLLRGAQVRNEADLLRCYRYWKEYHARTVD